MLSLKKIFSLLLIAYCTSSFAERKEYDVEVLIFEDLTSQYITSEKWPKSSTAADQELNDDGIPKISESTPILITNIDTEIDSFAEFELGTELEPEYPVENSVINIIDIPQSILTEEAETIHRSRRYKILLHKAWRQTGLDKNSMIEIPVDSRDYRIETSTKKDDLSLEVDVNAEETDSADKSYLEGVINVELARYLHFYTELSYHKPHEPMAPIAGTQKKMNTYPIKTHRRMRSKVLHYIDHPLMGILVKIIPVEITIEEEEITADSSNTAEKKN